MLKLTYTENSFYLEYLPKSLEEWVTQRVILSLRVGDRLVVEPSTASFLMPADLPGLDLLIAEIRRQQTDEITICQSDAKDVEVSLNGTWLSSDAENIAGVFVTNVSSSIEFFLCKLWQEAQMSASVLTE